MIDELIQELTLLRDNARKFEYDARVFTGYCIYLLAAFGGKASSRDGLVSTYQDLQEALQRKVVRLMHGPAYSIELTRSDGCTLIRSVQELNDILVAQRQPASDESPSPDSRQLTSSAL